LRGDFQAGGTVIQTLTVFFSTGAAAPFSFEFVENRPIDSDSGRSRAKSESRKFPFEIKSKKF
jgi:hypothetical protein